MTAADQNALDAIERDRRKREKELLLLLLLLVDDGRQHAQSAVRLGVDPVQALRNVIVGAPNLNQPGAAGGIAETMVNAYVAGTRRPALMADVPPVVMDTAIVRRTYDAYAVNATQALYRQMAEKVTRALQNDFNADVNARVRAIRAELEKAGLSRVNPSLLERMAETAVIRAYQDGYGDGFSIPNVKIKLKGFKYIAVVDDRTTDICRAYNGVQLPVDAQWWQGHAPPCHFGCRSTYRPIWRDFEPTVLIPTIEPEPGWGNAAISPLMPYEAVA